MAAERFILIQNDNDFTVLDTVKEKHMGVFEFKENEFPIYFCFHKIIDLLNKQHEQIIKLENELKGMEELLRSYRKTVEHDAELLADATRNGYLPPLENWKGDVE